jgi:hypothetical protein
MYCVSHFVVSYRIFCSCNVCVFGFNVINRIQFIGPYPTLIKFYYITFNYVFRVISSMRTLVPKVKVKISFLLIQHHAMKRYGEVAVSILSTALQSFCWTLTAFSVS